MTIWTFAQRHEALEPPTRRVNHYRYRTEWVKNRRAELGFPAEPYSEGTTFNFSKAGKKGYLWTLVDEAKAREVIDSLHIDREATTRENLQWGVSYQEAGLIAEGEASTIESAWAEACKIAGTDRLEIGRAGAVTELKRHRAKLARFDRLASLNPVVTDAQPQRYVFAESRFDADDYRVSDELRAHRQRFRYRRFKLVKETRLFYFCDLENAETIDRDGVVDTSWEPYIHRDPTLTRIRKDLWDAPEQYPWGEEKTTASRYIRNAPYGIGWVWLDLETMVAELDAARAGYLAAFNDSTEGENWAQILNLNLDDQAGLTIRDLQRAYRKAAMHTHPDHGGTAEAFQAVQQAYEVGQRILASV